MRSSAMIKPNSEQVAQLPQRDRAAGWVSYGQMWKTELGVVSHWETIFSINQSINQLINLYRAIVQRRVLQCGYAESRRNVLRRILNVLTDGAVRQFSGREFQSLGAATEKRRAAVSKLCGGTDRSFCVDDRNKRDWLYGLIKSAR